MCISIQTRQCIAYVYLYTCSGGTSWLVQRGSYTCVVLARSLVVLHVQCNVSITDTVGTNVPRELSVLIKGGVLISGVVLYTVLYLGASPD